MKIIDWVIGLFKGKQEVDRSDEIPSVDDNDIMEILKRTEGRFIEASIELNTFDAEMVVGRLMQKHGGLIDDYAKQQLTTYAHVTMKRAMQPRYSLAK